MSSQKARPYILGHRSRSMQQEQLPTIPRLQALGGGVGGGGGGALCMCDAGERDGERWGGGGRAGTMYVLQGEGLGERDLGRG